MESVLHTDTIYAGEVNLMSYMGIWRTLRGSDPGQEALAGRIAYALADMNGNIVQIYPPFRQDTSGAVPWNLPVYVDLPEGDYIQKILLNIPEDPDKWYDLRMRDDFNHYNISRANDYVDRSLEWTKYLPIFHGTAPKWLV